MEERKYYPQRGHKPASTHPWKNTKLLNGEKSRWINEHASNPYPVNFKVGGGKPQK